MANRNHRPCANGLKCLLSSALLLFSAAAMCAAPSHPAPDAATRQLAWDVFRQLIEFNTADSANDTTSAASALQRRFANAGFDAADAQLLGPNPHKQNLLVRLHGKPGARGSILMVCHLDVVEARREDWSTDPYRFVEQDGYVYGCGTQDIKSGCAILVATLIGFKREGYVPDRDLILALTAGEESGVDNGVDWLIRNHRDLIDAEYVLNPDSGSVDAVDGRVVSVQLGASEKLYADFIVSATNPGGHSSLPRPDNAIYALTAALERLHKYTFPAELNPVTRAFFERDAPLEDKATGAAMRGVLQQPPDAQALAQLSTDARFNSILRTTCVATRLQGGHANNALPQRAQATINCRILPGYSREDIRRELVRIVADPALSVHYLDLDGLEHEAAPSEKAMPPPPIRADLLTALDHIAAELWPKARVIPEMESGASDDVYTLAAGIPSYGVSGLALDRNDVRAHGKDERLRVNAFYEGLDFYGRLLRMLTSSP